MTLARTSDTAAYGLTRRARDLLVFITEYAERNGGIAPSYDEMVSASGLKSKSGIARLLDQLEERGHIHRLPHRARCIEVVRRAPSSPADGVTLSAEQRHRIRILADRYGITPRDLISYALNAYASGARA